MKHHVMRRITMMVVVCMTILVGWVPQISAASESETNITILHTNDIHGRVVDGIGFARLATLVEDFRTVNPNTLLLDAGDTVHGLPIATTFQGSSMIELMNAVGFDAMIAGNHDFNYGWNRLVELDRMANFPILAGNVLNGEQSILPSSYIIREFEDVKVGIFGVTTPETAVKTHPRNVEGLTFESPSRVAEQMVEILEPQVDIIVALGHLGTDAESDYTSTRVIEEVDGIDLFVDGHSHSLFPNGVQVGDTLLVSAGEHLQHLGIVDLVVENGELVSAEARVMNHNQVTVQPNEAVQSIVDRLNRTVEELGAEEIGYTSVFLEGARIPVRTSETNLGNFATDVLLSVTGADIALTNGGGIRDSINQGPITVGDISRVFPFGNSVEVRRVTGQQMKDALEHGTYFFPEESGAFPHVAGMSFVINVNRPAGERIENIMVGNEPLDLTREYRLATNDFIGAGGDGFSMIAEAELERQMMTLAEALIGYIRDHEGPISPEVEGRKIVRDVDEPEVDEEEDTDEEIEDEAEVIKATVTRVIDGDTIDIRLPSGQEERVRFIGVDAPERGEDFFDEATVYVRNLLDGREVYIEREGNNRDSFGRLRRHVWLAEPSTDEMSIRENLVGARLVSAGLAEILSNFTPRYAEIFGILLQEAQDAGRGMWATEEIPTPEDPDYIEVDWELPTPEVEPEYIEVEEELPTPEYIETEEELPTPELEPEYTEVEEALPTPEMEPTPIPEYEGEQIPSPEVEYPETEKTPEVNNDEVAEDEVVDTTKGGRLPQTSEAAAMTWLGALLASIGTVLGFKRKKK